MFIKKDLDFYDLQNECWSNAEDTLAKIAEYDMEDEFMDWLESYYGDEIPTMTELNDLLRFEEDFVYESIGLDEDGEDDEEDWDEDEDEDFNTSEAYEVLPDEDDDNEVSNYKGDGWALSNRGSGNNNNDSGWALDNR